MPTEDKGHTVETPIQARAGFLDRPVLVVLAASTLVIVIAFLVIYLRLGAGHTP